MRHRYTDKDYLRGLDDSALKAFKPKERNNHWLLHPDVHHPLQQLIDDAKNEGIELAICSAYRDYQRQEIIWNQKITGERPLNNLQGKVVDPYPLNPQDMLTYLLRWSAIPGCSRHHWGTDIDIYDASNIGRDDLRLVSEEYQPSGPCSKLNQWLTEKIASGASYGFFRPYEKDLGGVGPEPWHLSYGPLAKDYLEDYDFELFCYNIQKANFLLKDLIDHQAEYYYQHYLLNISSTTR